MALRALVFDFGTRRIGVASANRASGTATPLATLPARDGVPDWHDVGALVQDWEPEVLVVGLPRNADGTDSSMTARARAFGRWLAERSGLPTEEIDERYTSTDAEDRLREERRSGLRPRRVRPADIDRMAALLMAQSWVRAAPVTSQPVKPGHRDSIFLENARILSIQAFPGQQYLLRLEAPQCAARATPGSFVHLQCAADVPMRRPLSILRADAAGGWLEVLFKVVGAGLRSLAHAVPGTTLSSLGPIGNGFRPDPARPRVVLIGGGVGMPPLQFLAERLAAEGGRRWQPVVFFGSEIPFPFKPGRSRAPLHGVDHRVDACEPALEALGIPSRLASLAGFDGCHRGYVTALAGEWLAALRGNDRQEVAIFGCGPQAMLRAVAKLARDFGVPAQVCLEEYMACGVGGCAGCAVQVQTDAGPAMKRVCVDGPVFDSRAVYG